MLSLRTLSPVLVFAVAALMPLVRAVESTPAIAAENFDPKINSWAEGTVMSLDVDTGKFSIRGSKRPYATAYAKMLREIHDKTGKLTAEESAKKTAEIRSAWQPDLEKVRSTDSGAETDFTFRLPNKEGKLVYFDESAYYSAPLKNAPATGVKLTPSEHIAMLALKDLKVGEFVVVGYDGGVILNDAYVIIKATKPTAKASDATAPRGFGGVSVALDADTRATREIRRALVEDNNLSSSAKNVNVNVENGVAQLKGRVSTEQEKLDVESKAADIAGGAKIMSFLEVSSN